MTTAKERLRRAPAPKYEVKTRRKWTDAQLEAANAGRFEIYDRVVTLVPPVDWNPPGPPSYRAQLQAWLFMDALLGKLGMTRESFGRALTLALDWIAHTQDPAVTLGEYVWKDKITGDRATYLGYLTRLGGARGWLTDDQADTLLDAILEHGRRLADDASYAANSNHGLYQDAGLAQLAKYAAPILPEAAHWRTTASRRFVASLRALLEVDEGMWLEHSVAYQFNVLNLVRSVLRRETLDAEQLGDWLSRIEDVAGWLLQPDGKMSQVGDTNRVDGTHWKVPMDRTGLKFLPSSGWAIVKTRQSYLITSATFRSHVHKHADELSFEWFDRGGRLIADTGKYIYDPSDPFRVHARSAESHNNVIIDGLGGEWWRRRRPYGSGMGGACEQDGWYAVRARNPLAEEQGVSHTRTLVFRPGSLLVVVDTYESEDEHVFQRTFHFDPSVQIGGEGSWFERPGCSGRIRDMGGNTPTIHRGEDGPIAGWVAPQEATKVATYALRLTTTHTTGIDAVAFSLSGGEADLVGVRQAAEGLELTLTRQSYAILVDEGHDGLRLRRVTAPDA